MLSPSVMLMGQTAQTLLHHHPAHVLFKSVNTSYRDMWGQLSASTLMYNDVDVNSQQCTQRSVVLRHLVFLEIYSVES